MQLYDLYMRKCFELARKGEGAVSPNPLVGCVVLDKLGNEIAVGYHKKYGEKHAEADALSKLKNGEAKGGVLFVNLEPCCHFGKTPPCADLIINHGLSKVVIGMEDPNPIVASEGIKKLKDAGIQVVEDILNKEALALNEVFLKNMLEKKCFVAIKTATTLDGKISTKTGSSKWITSASSREEVQKIRNRYDAILTTSSTVIKDNPSMTCRLQGGRNPVKIILDRELRTNLDSKIYQTQGERVFIVVDENIEKSKISAIPDFINIIKCPVSGKKFKLDILFEKLFELGIMSVLVEAGSCLNGAIISCSLADKIYQFVAPKIIADKNALNAFEGRDVQEISDSIEFKLHDVKRFDDDILLLLNKK